MAKFNISEDGLNDICEVVENNNDRDNLKEKLSSIISKEWSSIYTIKPKTSLAIGLLLLVAVFLFDYFIEIEASNQKNYEFMIGLFCSLAAAAFSAVFTGSLNLDIKWLQASGTLAVFVLVFLSSPFQSEKKINDGPNFNESTSYIFLPVLNSFENRTYSFQDDKLNYTRIYYPRGVDDLKAIAFKIQNSLGNLSNNVDVYSLGSIFSVLSNSTKFSGNNYFIEIKYRPGIEKNKLDKIVQAIQRQGIPVKTENIKGEYTNADITIYIRI